MIGSVRFRLGDVMAEAVLQSNGLWQAPSEELTKILNARFPINLAGPWAGQPGYAQVYEAAKFLDGIVTVAPKPTPEDGKVY